MVRIEENEQSIQETVTAGQEFLEIWTKSLESSHSESRFWKNLTREKKKKLSDEIWIPFCKLVFSVILTAFPSFIYEVAFQPEINLLI